MFLARREAVKLLRVRSVLATIPTEMDFRFRALKLISKLMLALSWPAGVIAAATIMASLRMPEVELTRLYSWSLIAIRIGLGAILVFITLGWGLDLLANPFLSLKTAARDLRRRYSRIQAVAAVLLTALMISVLLPGVRYLHPESDRWIATGKTGPTEISSSLARLYMWRSIRMDAAFVFVAAWGLGGLSWSLLAAAKRVQLSGEDPAAVTYVRPRDYRG